MAFSPDGDQHGYATPAAMICSLGIALVATSFVTRSVATLKLSDNDLKRGQLEYVLAGAHLAAASAIIRSGAGGPYQWTFSTDAGWVKANAEDETPKLSLTQAATWDDDRFARFGVTDPQALKARLQSAPADAAVDVAALDDAPNWRACAPAMISSFGGSNYVYAPPGEPKTDSDLPAWRVGQIWRLALTTASGWREERIVRFTGDAHHPVAVVARRLTHSDRGEERCDAILAAA